VNVLLTGAFGNLGQATLGSLAGRGHRIRCLELDSRRNRAVAGRYRGRIEMAWGDITDRDVVAAAVAGQDVIVHLAAIIPPRSEAQPELTRAVNEEGTRHLVLAAEALESPPRFLLASTYDLFGHTHDVPPPRTATDPIEVTSHYTAAKKAAEEMVRASGLSWSILRFGSIIRIALGQFPAMAFELPVDQRLHIIHADDAGLAVANAVSSNEIRGRTLLVGGGANCQVQYGEFINGMMSAFGIGHLPAAAFTTKQYTTDWLDTAESQALLAYQRFGFEDIRAQTAALLGWRRHVMPVADPLVRRWFLSKSPYWRVTAGA
jgi:nucleoside-diphosphate-sugar epimerase